MATVMNAPTASGLSPREWCRHVLDALIQRKVDSRESGHVEVLLAYFIECDPTAEDLTALLARFAADPRPGIAAAAVSLQTPWERSRAAQAPAAPPPFQDALRTLGGLL